MVLASIVQVHYSATIDWNFRLDDQFTCLPSNSSNISSRCGASATSGRPLKPVSSPSRRSPPGLRELETLLGVTLVERTRRVVRFTALGEKIADKAIAHAARNRRTRRNGACAGPTTSWRASDGRHPDHRPVPAPHDAATAPQQWPSLKLYLREETSQAACDALHRGQLDCVLLALPYSLRRRRHRAAVRRSACSSLSRAAKHRRRKVVESQQIDENRMLLLEDGHCLKDHALIGLQPVRTFAPTRR